MIGSVVSLIDNVIVAIYLYILVLLLYLQGASRLSGVDLVFTLR